MKKITSLFVFLGLLALSISSLTVTPSPISLAANSAVNRVFAQFHTAWNYESPEDIFVNNQVIGSKWWGAYMMNSPDETGSSVTALSLNLESTMTFDMLKVENLVTSGPPAYEWFFGDVPEQSSVDAWVDSQHDSNPVPITFTPGFGASRTLDKTEFSETRTQSLTITLTPREIAEGFSIIIRTVENDILDSLIISPASGDGINLAPDGHSLNIDPIGLELNTTWTIDVTIQVIPKVPKVTFMPYVIIGQSDMVASGNESSSALAHPVGDRSDGIGDWTWRAEGLYEWEWDEKLSKRVVWAPRNEAVGETDHEAVGGTDEMIIPSPLSTLEGEGNAILVSFSNEFRYKVSGNTFTNTEVTGDRWWRTNFTNYTDETGAPVNRLRVILDTELEFDEVEHDKQIRMGPPTHEWYLGNVVEESEREGWGWDAFVVLHNYPAKFSPGLDVIRSFDKTVFNGIDTQTMTIIITPREEWVEIISVSVHTEEEDLINPVIKSISHTGDGEVTITQNGQRSEVYRIPVELNTPITIVYTLQIEPKVPEVEFTPGTGIKVPLTGQLASGTTSGDSVSHTNEAGTWTWNADGNYVWYWQETIFDYGIYFHWRVSQPRAEEEPGTTPPTIPDSTEESSWVNSWQFEVGIIAGVVVIGVITYFFIRMRRKRASS